ncbi:MAG: hypothetical protein HPKKFMNG_01188 [Planctomycetes bacterium]|nr:hypothetical protein [Planctomycetota bacterium]
MAKAPHSSNTQLGISEQTAREFKRIAEQEEQAGTEAWNDGEYDTAASHFERAASTLKKYAAHVQAAAQAQVIKRKAAKLLDLCRQLRDLTQDGKPDESKARKLRTESQSELAVINADLEAATPKEAAPARHKSKAENLTSAPTQPPTRKEAPDDKPAPAEPQSESKPNLRLVGSKHDGGEVLELDFAGVAPKAEGSGRSAPALADPSEQKTAPSLQRIIEGQTALKPERVVELSRALGRCDFEVMAKAFDAISDDFSAGHAPDPGVEIERLLSSVFAREIAQVLRKAPGDLSQGAMELARRAYGEGNFKGAAEHFKQAAMELLGTGADGRSDEDVAASEMKASKLLTFSSRLRKAVSDGKPTT